MKLSKLTDGFDWNNHMGTTARRMRDTGFETWGFLIYRCTYGDDAAWDCYMQLFKEQVHDDLVCFGRELLMEQYPQWTVIEDKETLDGASKKQGGLPTRNDASTRLPRFTYCLYVDQRCLDTMKAYLDAKDSGAPLLPYLVAVIIDGWEYAEAGSLASLYETLHYQRMDLGGGYKSQLSIQLV
ncbi:hypothetical protein F5Y19DRAFT_472644 [Xylariaceae sp. FL1651]|nr:hypothetical protein F5Y19DRAFT_472644 [Xylariaceae sp. FL1651]